MADMKERFVPEDGVSLKVLVHTLQVFHMPTVGDSVDIDPIIQLFAIHVPNCDGQYE